MKITDLRMETYRYASRRFTPAGRFVFGGDGLDVVKVDTDEGITGVGLGWSVGRVDALGRNIAEFYKQTALGKDPLDHERLWADLWQPNDLGRRGIGTRVLSSIDVALWDIKGKVACLPLYKLLGGYADKVPAYVSRGHRGEGAKEVAAGVEDSVSQGVRAIKMQIGNVPYDVDVARVGAARAAAGPDVKLMVDASSGYKHHEAIIIAEKLEQFDIFWLEEPVAVDDLRGYQLVAEATSIPIATGEGEQTRYGFRDLIERRCAAILQPDALIVGGITEWMKVAAMSQAYDLVMSPHGPHQVHVHLMSAIPNGIIMEEYYTSETEPIDGGIFKDILTIKDGFLHPPDLPGLGFELNDEALAPYRTG